MEYLSFSTRAASPSERSAQWKSIIRCEAQLGDDREASIRGCDLGDLQICGVTLGQYRLDSIRRAHGTDQRIKFLFIEDGKCEVEQDGKRILLGAGQWCAIDKDRSFRMEATAATRQLSLALPNDRVIGLDDNRCRLVQPLGFLHGAANVLHSSAAAAVNAAPHMGRRDRSRLGDALAHLLNVAWDTDPLGGAANSQRARRLVVLDFIERNLCDRELNVPKIAKELGYSKRTLHKLFADEALTISRIIWNRRLEHCRQELLDPSQARRSITEIAHDCGFSDSQHFSRAFKSHFGITPREFRNSNLLQ